jgi:hypothetical protein
LDTVKFKVMCVDGYQNRLTEGRVYEAREGVGGIEDDLYIIYDDDSGNETKWFRWRFEKLPEETTAKGTQVGGSHYTKLAIQPYEYTLSNNLGGLEHTIIKYVTRWKDKGGLEDLKKAKHTLEFLIEWTESKTSG